ncbi:MAG: hypothetical protein VB095_05930 [Anaerovorax sp.]|nr:hypothetical protein [Anaerovorax sp.]
MKKIIYIVCIGIIIIIGYIGLADKTSSDLETLFLDGKTVTLQLGDSYYANGWNEDHWSYLNETKYEVIAATGRKITTGSTLEKVIKAYQIKTGYAIWNIEIDRERDGNTEIEYREYIADEFDESDVLNAILTVAYFSDEGQWYPLNYEELIEYVSYINGKSVKKPYDNVILYGFEFPFNDYSELVPDKTLAGYKVDYK